MADREIINIGKQYSRYPVGRYRADGSSNGEKFREDVLRPAFVRSRKVTVEFDDALGYGSSFLEEAFAGLIRGGMKKDDVLNRLECVTSDDSLRQEVLSYIREA